MGGQQGAESAPQSLTSEQAVYSPGSAVRGGQEERDFLHSRRRASCKGFSRHVGEGLLRTAVRNMVCRGIPERVAMTIRDRRAIRRRSVFDRYKIVSKSDLHEAAKKLPQQDQESEPGFPVFRCGGSR